MNVEKKLTKREATELLGRDLSTFDRYIERGLIEPIQDGARAVFDAEQIAALKQRLEYGTSELLTTKTAAERLGRRVDWLQQVIRKGWLKAVKDGRRWLVPVEELEQLKQRLEGGEIRHGGADRGQGRKSKGRALGKDYYFVYVPAPKEKVNELNKELTPDERLAALESAAQQKKGAS